jgi:hypothetical protein
MKTVLQDIPDDLASFMAMPEGLYKNIIYERQYKNSNYVIVDVVQQDGIIYAGIVTMKLCRSSLGKYYSRAVKKQGFTFKDKKIKVWFGGSSLELQQYIGVILKHIGHSWIAAEHRIHSFITKGALERILTRKITNPTDLCAYYLKSMRMKASPTLLYKAMNKGVMSKMEFLRYAGIALYIDHFLQRIIDGAPFIGNMQDLINQAQQLNKKIDFNWSDKRMEREHLEWTYVLMQAELPYIDDEPVTYPPELFDILPTEFELLDNKKRVFEEGTVMYHCVYTSYWTLIKNLDYLAFHVNLNGEHATFGVDLRHGVGNLMFSQVYQRRNNACSPEMIAFCKNWATQHKHFSLKPQLETCQSQMELV